MLKYIWSAMSGKPCRTSNNQYLRRSIRNGALGLELPVDAPGVVATDNPGLSEAGVKSDGGKGSLIKLGGSLLSGGTSQVSQVVCSDDPSEKVGSERVSGFVCSLSRGLGDGKAQPSDSGVSSSAFGLDPSVSRANHPKPAVTISKSGANPSENKVDSIETPPKPPTGVNLDESSPLGSFEAAHLSDVSEESDGHRTSFASALQDSLLGRASVLRAGGKPVEITPKPPNHSGEVQPRCTPKTPKTLTPKTPLFKPLNRKTMSKCPEGASAVKLPISGTGKQQVASGGLGFKKSGLTPLDSRPRGKDSDVQRTGSPRRNEAVKGNRSLRSNVLRAPWAFLSGLTRKVGGDESDDESVEYLGTKEEIESRQENHTSGVSQNPPQTLPNPGGSFVGSLWQALTKRVSKPDPKPCGSPAAAIPRSRSLEASSQTLLKPCIVKTEPCPDSIEETCGETGARKPDVSEQSEEASEPSELAERPQFATAVTLSDRRHVAQETGELGKCRPRGSGSLGRCRKSAQSEALSRSIERKGEPEPGDGREKEGAGEERDVALLQTEGLGESSEGSETEADAEPREEKERTGMEPEMPPLESQEARDFAFLLPDMGREEGSEDGLEEGSEKGLEERPETEDFLVSEVAGQAEGEELGGLVGEREGVQTDEGKNGIGCAEAPGKAASQAVLSEKMGTLEGPVAKRLGGHPQEAEGPETEPEPEPEPELELDTMQPPVGAEPAGLEVEEAAAEPEQAAAEAEELISASGKTARAPPEPELAGPEPELAALLADQITTERESAAEVPPEPGCPAAEMDPAGRPLAIVGGGVGKGKGELEEVSTDVLAAALGDVELLIAEHEQVKYLNRKSQVGRNLARSTALPMGFFQTAWLSGSQPQNFPERDLSLCTKSSWKGFGLIDGPADGFPSNSVAVWLLASKLFEETFVALHKINSRGIWFEQRLVGPSKLRGCQAPPLRFSRKTLAALHRVELEEIWRNWLDRRLS
jgi:hypothetical protein